MIPREIIEEIIFRNDIEQVVGSYVTLKRSGASNMVGLCPFHSEKTPSFSVNTSKNFFHCFGCGAGGDVITFIMKIENLDYVGAVEFLAARAGINIPEDGGKEEKNSMPRKRVYEMNLAAARYFRECLFDNEKGKVGMDYLAGQRKLSLLTIKHFGLGFSPNDWGFVNHMHSLGFTDDEMVEGYLMGISQKTGKAYALFRNRVMFPIIDTTGNIIAFGGRVMDDSKPKYLNSSDTPAFKKSNNLFALNYAKNNCSEFMILCEGYMDVIALHAAGFENAVATLGTAITPQQARIFAKYTKKVIISYDSDEAGQKAADRAMKLLSEAGLEVRVLKMSGAKDPDEYIKKFGKDKFRALLGESRTGFDFKLEKVTAKYDIEGNPEDKIKASGEIIDIISEYYSAVEREIYISKAAKLLSLPTDVIKNDVERARSKKIREYKRGEGQMAQMNAKGIGDRINPDKAKNISAASAEETILGLMLLKDDLRAKVASGEKGISADDFFGEFGKRVFENIVSLENSEKGFMFALLGENFSPDEMGRIRLMEQTRSELYENGENVLDAAISALKRQKEKSEDKKNGDFLSTIERRRQAALEKKKEKENEK